MRIIRLPFLVLLILFLLISPFPLVANQDGVVDDKVLGLVINYPGLEEVVPRSTKFDGEVATAVRKIDALATIDEFKRQAENLEHIWNDEYKHIETLGPIEKWPINRLLNTRENLEETNQKFTQLLQQLATPLKTIEEERKKWSDSQLFWREWQRTLRETGAKVPVDTFTDVQGKLKSLLLEIDKASTRLIKLQEKISKTSQSTQGLTKMIETELATLKESPLRRNAFPLISKEYLAQFQYTSPMWNQARDGAIATFQVHNDFLKRQGWVLFLQLAMIVFLYISFRQIAEKTAEKVEDWHFVFNRPLAASLFVSSFAPSFFYAAPPPLLEFFILFVATFAAARLVCELIQESNQRTLVYTLAVIFIIAKAFTALALPVPLYRLYLSIMAVAGIPFLVWLKARHLKHVSEGVDRYLIILNLGKTILVVALLAQLVGFASFSLNLINATVGTIFLMFFTMMARKIAEGGIELFFASNLWGKTRFVKGLGGGASARITRLSDIVILGFAALSLLEVWGVYDDISTAWKHILNIEFVIGEFHLSVQMVFLVIFVIYLSIIISWFVQTFLESQIFFGKRIDRGVRDAFKKLVHYSLMLIGLVSALGMAGIKLENFAILAGAFGIGIGFGLQDIVNNFVSGLILLFERPIKVGDAVIIDEQWGTINKIGLRSTIVETWDHSEIIVPNSQMISEKVLNWTLSSNVSRITIKVGVRYGTDLEKVINILSKIGDSHPSVVTEPTPSAIFTDFGDSSINFELRVWVDNIKNRLAVISDLGLEIDKAFKKANIQIPFPQRDIHIRSGQDIRT